MEKNIPIHEMRGLFHLKGILAQLEPSGDHREEFECLGKMQASCDALDAGVVVDGNAVDYKASRRRADEDGS